ncbi:MAG: para-aminobenzoate synthetase component 1 [Lentimonas sp.]|jgi:para-aminobenzoate synthetase component 1
MRIKEIANPPSIDALIERFGSRDLSFILDSSLSNDGLGEWSFFGANPFLLFEGKDGSYVEHRTSNFGHVQDEGFNGLERLRKIMTDYSVENVSAIPFIGGAVGFIGYDYGRQVEEIPVLATDDRQLPDIYFGLYDGIAALNHKTGVLSLVALGIRDDADSVIEELQAIVESRVDIPSDYPEPQRGAWEWNVEPAAYLEAVGRVKDYIASGDVYQVNLSQRARCRFEGCPIQLYQALRTHNPAPYGALMDCGKFVLFSTSPEQFLRKRGRQVETRPIKGTRPRGETAEEDVHNAAALQSSEKDLAELLMIVDLERNDLGRVAEFGSVQVEQLYHLEHYASVIHQTATVKARLAEGRDVFDCIQALFPGGSITGAPKVRAMEVIEELEPTRRGVYTGSIGYIGFDGDAEFNIAIRSLHLKDGHLDYQVGSGIVWDSKPEDEYQETLDKGRAIREAIDTLCQKL